MKNWLWDKKFAFMAWLKSPYMKRAWERFFSNEVVCFLVIVIITCGYAGFWVGIGWLVYELTENKTTCGIAVIAGALLTLVLTIFVGYYRKEKANYLAHGRHY